MTFRDPYAPGRALLDPMRAALEEAASEGSATWQQMWRVFRRFIVDPPDEAVVAHDLLQFEIHPRRADGGCSLVLERHAYIVDVDEPLACAFSLEWPDVRCSSALVQIERSLAGRFEAEVESAVAKSGVPDTPGKAEVWLEEI